MAFRDLQFSIDDLVAEGKIVRTRATWMGTHIGGFQGLSPTGKRVSISAFIAERIQDGKIGSLLYPGCLTDKRACWARLSVKQPRTRQKSSLRVRLNIKYS